MGDEEKYASLPIPTYEEATSSRPGSSLDFRGAQEISDDAERQGLLGSARTGGEGGGTGGGAGGARQAGYRPPTVESPRSSEDSDDLHLPEVTSGNADARRPIEELDYLDPLVAGAASQQQGYHRTRIRHNFSKRLASLSATFSSLRLPSFRALYTPTAGEEGADASEESPRLGAHPSWLSRFRLRGPIPDEYRMSVPIAARVCGLFIIALTIYFLFLMDVFSSGQMGAHFNAEAVRQFVQGSANKDNIAAYLSRIASFDHVAGTEGDYYLATWMKERWLAFDSLDKVEMQEYYVYLNYPTPDGRSVKIISPETKKWTAKLEEEVVDADKKQTLAWHGHSKSGEAKGHLIYANGGSRQDFQWLKDHGVRIQGAIALVREQATQMDRGLKIKAAIDAGCVGVLIFPDHVHNGAAGKGDWPDGHSRPDDSVERGSVSAMSWGIGDPLTPGWASSKQARRIDKHSSPVLAGIPSLPLAWRDARILLQGLERQGVQVPEEWVGGGDNGDGGPGSRYSGTDAESGLVVELRNVNDENEQQRIWNLHALIEGFESPEKRVIVGNHRDAWCFGAADPGSGTAVMMEVMSIFHQLRLRGWRPLRTIEFASWDASLYNLVGSTEFVEENVDYLRQHGVAYLNVGAGVAGPHFRAAGSPVMTLALSRVLQRVSDPHSNRTLKEVWDAEPQPLPGLGTRGDYVPLQSIAGVSSLDFGFGGADGDDDAHAATGSCYETFDWMQRSADPGFARHHALAQVWALLILELADEPLLPLDLPAYVQALQLAVLRLQQAAERRFGQSLAHDADAAAVDPTRLTSATGFDLQPLRTAVAHVQRDVTRFTGFATDWAAHVFGAGAAGPEVGSVAQRRLQQNARAALFESHLLDVAGNDDGDDGEAHGRRYGVPRREQFRHVVYGPSAWGGAVQEAEAFPAVRDAVEEGDWEGAQRMVERAARLLRRAGRMLVQ